MRPTKVNFLEKSQPLAAIKNLVIQTGPRKSYKNVAARDGPSVIP